jgi:hypothetical protein
VSIALVDFTGAKSRFLYFNAWPVWHSSRIAC